MFEIVILFIENYETYVIRNYDENLCNYVITHKPM